MAHSDLGQQTTFETTHIKQQVRVVFAVRRYEAVFPLECGHRPRYSVLDVPEYRPSQVHVVLHQSHTSITGPTLEV